MTPPVRSQGADAAAWVPAPDHVPFEWAQAESSIAERFVQVASTLPDRLALDDGSQALSYAQLLTWSAQRAAGVAHAAGTAAGVVAVLLPFGAEVVATLLAVLRAGHAFLPLDPAALDAHLRQVLLAAAPALVLSDAAGCARLQQAVPELSSLIRDVQGLCTSALGWRLDRLAEPGHHACVFATSGTTGSPKLVALPHRAVLFDIGRQQNDLLLSPTDRFDLLFSLAFSASLAPLFGALLTGASLHLLDTRHQLPRLPGWLAKQRISISTMGASTLRFLNAHAEESEAYRHLRLLSLGGEALRAADVNQARQALGPQVVIQNAMAATETRTWAQHFMPQDALVTEPLPMGWPVHGKSVRLVPDASPALAAWPQAGRVWVRSRYLATGYLHQPQLTAERFVPQADGSMEYDTGDLAHTDEQGRLYFLGRADDMVKVRGHRVELAEVEGALRELQGVVDAAAVALEDAARGTVLVAFVVGARSAPASALQAALRQCLPEPAVPAVIHHLPELPRNLNGKVDRQALARITGPR